MGKKKGTTDKASGNGAEVHVPKIDLRHKYDDDGKYAKFANHVTVQFDAHEFHISFFEIQPPLKLGTAEEKIEYIKSLDHVDANCVARVVISTGRMPAVLKALIENVAKNLPGSLAEIKEPLNSDE